MLCPANGDIEKWFVVYSGLLPHHCWFLSSEFYLYVLLVSSWLEDRFVFVILRNENDVSRENK